MAQIQVSDLTFCYEGSYDTIFENVSFCIDTDWKLGLIGRNGKGKTTFLKLLMGEYEYQGSIRSSVKFDYFPYILSQKQLEWDTLDWVEAIRPDYELWKLCRELELLRMDAGVLYRPVKTLSHGERTKVMLALLFSGDHAFLLIDEPTNHLDMDTRRQVQEYLKTKKGFILVSHDRQILDACVDHVLALERCQIRVEKGNFSTWWENRQRREQHERTENEKRRQEIAKLEEAARKTALWAEKVERTKIGFDPVKEPDRTKDTRAYLGEKSRRMQQRRKNVERRRQIAIEEKAGLLKNVEETEELKLMPLAHYKECYVLARDMTISYGDYEAVSHFSMELKRGERILLRGANGCGKSSIIKAILSLENVQVLGRMPSEFEDADRQIQGELTAAKGLRISYISQDTSFLKGKLEEYAASMGLDASLFRAILRKLDFERTQFDKNMETYSEGQKKKVLAAGSLLQQAHLYIWDEPLNYIDLFSRMQIEDLICRYRPTMLLVEHDQAFGERCATRIIELPDRA